MTLKQLRAKAGLSQRALALRLGVQKQTVCRWDTGETWPRSWLLRPLAGALGVSVDELLDVLDGQ